MSRRRVQTTKAMRAFLAASSALVLITSASPVAFAADHGKSGGHGKPASPGKSVEHGKHASRSAVDEVLKAIQQSPVFNGKGKKFENDGKALAAQTGSLSKKLNKLGAAYPALLPAINTYLASVDTATATFQVSVKSAKGTYKAALTAATTDTAKQSAETAYKAAVLAAQQSFNTAIKAANLALRAALGATLGSASPSPSPSST